MVIKGDERTLTSGLEKKHRNPCSAGETVRVAFKFSQVRVASVPEGDKG